MFVGDKNHINVSSSQFSDFIEHSSVSKFNLNLKGEF